MSVQIIPENIQSLHHREEQLRVTAMEFVSTDARMLLHLRMVECAMDVADILRQVATDDEDLKVVQLLGMRTFNAFGASLKLALSGYSQNSALIMRDILETVFLLDLFRVDRTAIRRWRFADKKERMKFFSPVQVREALDARDGFTGKKRAEIYDLLSELAGHPTMKSPFMMRPQKDGDAVIGPFIEKTMQTAVLSEMGRLAVQVGETLNALVPVSYGHREQVRTAFELIKQEWLAEFYGKVSAPQT